jgi:CRISPR-associated protein Cmr1
MEEVLFTLRTVTPMFLTGADQETAELRAPTFRGLMRYWQRALLGGLVGTQNVEKVKKAETAIFGATDKGSAVIVKVSEASQEPREFTEAISIRVGGTWQATGKGYLLWSMAKSGKAERGNLKPARWFFRPDTRFQVTLSARGNDATGLKQAVAAFWLLTQLGGIGSRSRRCAGSLSVLEVSTNNPTNLLFTPSADVPALKLALENGIKEARTLARQALEEAKDQALQFSSGAQADFDILANGKCSIWILQKEQPWSSAEDAMKGLGESLQDFRRDIPIEERKIFGLPLPPIIFNKRRSSPLLLRVTELQNNKYVGIAVLFQTAGRDVVMKDYRHIRDWIATFSGRKEVQL